MSIADGISIITGTLNRKIHLPRLIENTVDADNRLELVLVDGGSTDGTIDFIQSLNHPRIKLIEVGHRSCYAHFMNLGVKAARYEWVCQWNDDVVLVTGWDDIFHSIDDSAFYIFAWKFDAYPKYKDKEWKLINSKHSDGSGEIVVNFGIYHKKVFRTIGLYNDAYHFYCADGDMAQRAWYFGFNAKSCPAVKVVSIKGIKKSRSYELEQDWQCYQKHIEMYSRKVLPDNLEYLV
jgi:glycosyltransferase involved in cell wall biosynthesis